jgi:hypothetical protein
MAEKPRMPLRERFLAAVAGRTDVPPVLVPDLSYWLGAHPLPEGDDLQATLRFHQRLGVLPYYVYGSALCFIGLPEVQARNVTVSSHCTATVWETPLGPLRKETTALPESHTQAITGYPVRTAEDLRRLIAMYRTARVVRLPIEAYRERTRTIAEHDGYGLVSVPRSPVPALLTDWAGVTNGITLLADELDLCQEFFALVGRLALEAVDILCEEAPPLIHVCDNLTSDVYTPYFAGYLEPHYRAVLGRLHAAGSRVATHLDGTVRGLLPRLAQVGFDIVEALTPAPVGDATAAEMRALAGPRMVLWGGLPGAMFAAPWTWEQFRAHVLEVLEAWRGTPFILGVADQLPPDGDIEFVRRTAQMLEEMA